MESNQEQEQDQIDDWQDDLDEEEETCRSCGCAEDLVFDDDGCLVCCDCLFEEESYNANQP